MKNINYVGGKKYIEALTDQQLAWLERDLSFVPKGSTVFLNMHAAAWNKVANDGNVRNAKQLAKVLEGYNVHVFCGHTHYYQNIIVSPTLYQHNIAAACGAWWAGKVSVCGAPNGYLIVDVDGNDVRWHYKPTGMPVTKQMRLYAPGAFKTQKDYLVASIWDWDDSCHVAAYADGKALPTPERFTDIDEAYVEQQQAAGKKPQQVQTPHLFRTKVPEGTHQVRVVFTNRFGEAYSETQAL